jgi:hypothetical protein
LRAVIEDTQGLTGRQIERVYVDKGYRGHDAPNPRRVFISGQKRGVFGAIKHELRFSRDNRKKRACRGEVPTFSAFIRAAAPPIAGDVGRVGVGALLEFSRTIIATEDLHWADPSTLELIQLLVEQGPPRGCSSAV